MVEDMADEPPARAREVQEQEPAFRALYEAHVDFVWRSLVRLGVREADLMDSVQKVFLTAFLRRADHEGRGAFTSWLFGIAQRVASDHRRSAPVRREVPTEAAKFEAARLPEREQPDQASQLRERAALAESILASLPEAQRIVFALYEVEGMSGQEIAAALALPLGTVRSRLRLARDAFRAELARRGQSREAV